MKRLPLRNLMPALMGLAAVSLSASFADAQAAASAARPIPVSPITTGLASHGFNNLQATEAARLFHQPQQAVQAPLLPVFNNQALDPETYRDIKEAAHVGHISRDGSGAVGPMTGIQPMTAATAGMVHIKGLNATQTGGWYPPDGGFSVGPNHLVQMLNNNIQIYKKTLSKATIAFTGTSMNDFFGYNAANGYSSAQPCFDPRVLYDKTTGHWFLVSDAFAESSSVQYFCIAASVDSNPLDGFHVYIFNVNPYVAGNQTASNAFFDFPNIGQDSQNLIITTNVFSTNFGVTMFLLNKAGLVSGGFGGWAYTGLAGTLTPPDVESAGTSGYGYLIFPQPYTSAIGSYRLNYSSTNAPQLYGTYNLNAPYYEYPPAALQPGTNAQLETLDTRFGTQSVQFGDTIYNVNCVGVNGFATVRMYSLNGYTGALNETHDLYAKSTSDDFMPAMSADSAGSWVVGWDSTNDAARYSTADYQNTVYYSSKQPADTAPAAPKPISGSKSSTYYLGGRTGDYNAMVRDPSNQLYFWGEAWDIMDNYDWTTEIYNIHFSSP